MVLEEKAGWGGGRRTHCSCKGEQLVVSDIAELMKVVGSPSLLTGNKQTNKEADIMHVVHIRSEYISWTSAKQPIRSPEKLRVPSASDTKLISNYNILLTWKCKYSIWLQIKRSQGQMPPCMSLCIKASVQLTFTGAVLSCTPQPLHKYDKFMRRQLQNNICNIS